MKHPTTLKFGYSIRELAREIASLRYDVLEEFLEALSQELQKDALEDHKKGRTKLALLLLDTSKNFICGGWFHETNLVIMSKTHEESIKRYA